MKLNFFSRIYLAITDFRLYPFIVQKEKFISAFAYFLCFIILISAILATGAVVKIVGWSSEFMTVYDSKINDFAIKDGVLDLEENMDFDFKDVKIYANDLKTYEDIDFDSFDLFDIEEYQIALIALKDSFAIGSPKIGFVISKYKELNMDITKQNLYDSFTVALESPLFRVSLTGAILCGVFVAYLLTKFLNVIGVSLMLLFLGLVFRVKYKFKDYIKVAFYVITLPIITELIVLITTGEITDYSYITYYLLIYVYMYYAIRALKLDNIITTTHEKIMGMKSDEQNDNKIETSEKQKESKDENNKE